MLPVVSLVLLLALVRAQLSNVVPHCQDNITRLGDSSQLATSSVQLRLDLESIPLDMDNTTITMQFSINHQSLHSPTFLNEFLSDIHGPDSISIIAFYDQVKLVPYDLVQYQVLLEGPSTHEPIGDMAPPTRFASEFVACVYVPNIVLGDTTTAVLRQWRAFTIAAIVIGSVILVIVAYRKIRKWCQKNGWCRGGTRNANLAASNATKEFALSDGEHHAISGGSDGNPEDEEEVVMRMHDYALNGPPGVPFPALASSTTQLGNNDNSNKSPRNVSRSALVHASDADDDNFVSASDGTLKPAKPTNPLKDVSLNSIRTSGGTADPATDDETS